MQTARDSGFGCLAMIAAFCLSPLMAADTPQGQSANPPKARIDSPALVNAVCGPGFAASTAQVAPAKSYACVSAKLICVSGMDLVAQAPPGSPVLSNQYPFFGKSLSFHYHCKDQPNLPESYPWKCADGFWKSPYTNGGAYYHCQSQTMACAAGYELRAPKYSEYASVSPTGRSDLGVQFSYSCDPPALIPK